MRSGTGYWAGVHFYKSKKHRRVKPHTKEAQLPMQGKLEDDSQGMVSGAGNG